MYDTLNLTLLQRDFPNMDFMAELPQYMEDCEERINQQRGLISIVGNIGGMSARVQRDKYVISGSLTKYERGNNFDGLTREQTQRAIERLSDTMHIPIEDALVSRVDFGVSFPVYDPVDEYFPILGNAYGYRILEQTHGKTYKKNNLTYGRELCFYDKIKEAGKAIPEDWRWGNTLRYELRLTARPAKQLEQAKLYASHLYNELIWRKFVETWAEEYQKINKMRMMEMKKASSEIELFNLLVRFTGMSESELCKWVAKSKGSSRTTENRLKQKIRSAFKSGGENPLAEEMDRKIQRIKEELL